MKDTEIDFAHWDRLWKEYDRAREAAPQTAFKRHVSTLVTELMRRDPLVKDLSKEFNLNFLMFKERGYVPSLRLDGFGIFIKEAPASLRKLIGEVEKKWYCSISTSFHDPAPPFDLWSAVFNIPAPVEIPIRPAGMLHWPVDALGDLPHSLPYSPLDKLPLTINLSVINKNDVKYIKRIVGQVVNQCLDSKPKEHATRVAIPCPLLRDPDINFLYHLNTDGLIKKFYRDLEWYDMRIDERFSFRLIAKIDKTAQERGIETASKYVRRLREAPKRERIGKDEIARRKYPEDKIEKAVKRIYKAIHRKPYYINNANQTEPALEEWTGCPEHGDNCPQSCSHLQRWYNRFNRLHKVT